MATFKKIFFLCMLVVCITGCASLTKTQVSGVHSFSKLLGKYTDYPGFIIQEFVQLKYEVEQLNTGTFNDTSVNTKLWVSYYGRKKALNEATKMDIGIKVVAAYASALEKLSSTGLTGKIEKGSERFGTNIDTLITLYNSLSKDKIPTNIGALVSSAFTFVAGGYVRHKQADDLKNFVGEGETFIPALTDVIKTELKETVADQWLPALKADLKTRQTNFLQNIPRSEYKVYFANTYNKDVALLIERIDNLEQLTDKAISSIGHIQKAHEQLLENIRKRKNLDEVLSETRQLYLAVDDMYTNYQHLLKN